MEACGWRLIVTSLCLFLRLTAADDVTCTNNCSVDTSDGLDCYTGAQAYYDRTTVQALRDWLAVQDSMQQWWFRHNTSHTTNTTAIGLEAAERWSSVPQEGGRLLDADTLQTVALTIAAKTQTSRQLAPPDYTCPVPCDYQCSLWQYMFYASVLLNVALCVAVMPFMFLTLRQERRLAHQPLK